MINFPIFRKDDKEKKEPVSPEPKKEHRQEQGGSKINFFRAFLERRKKKLLRRKKKKLSRQAPLSGPVSFPAICKNNEQKPRRKKKRKRMLLPVKRKNLLFPISIFFLFSIINRFPTTRRQVPACRRRRWRIRRRSAGPVRYRPRCISKP